LKRRLLAGAPHDAAGVLPFSRARIALRLAFAAAAALTFACGVLAGLARFGVTVPLHALSNAQWHGVLMLPIFFGAVVSVERAVALGGGRHVCAPAAVMLAGLALLSGASPIWAQAMLIVGATLALVDAWVLVRRQPALHLSILASSVSIWWFGDILWFATGAPLFAVPSWLAFLVLTIAAERLELTRMRPTPARARAVFVSIVVIMLAGIGWALRDPELGLRAFSACLLLLAAWLARYDIARVTVRQRGLTRFIAVCLLSGYGWLALSGVLGLFGAWNAVHPWHDGALHALTLGFVASMALGHAPIVLPALARLRVRYRPIFYLPLIALNITLALRVGGVMTQAFALRRAGALGNALALLLFVIVMASAAWAARGEFRMTSSRR
jgi:hypothetical protein